VAIGTTWSSTSSSTLTVPEADYHAELSL